MRYLNLGSCQLVNLTTIFKGSPEEIGSFKTNKPITNNRTNKSGLLKKHLKNTFFVFLRKEFVATINQI